MLRAAEPHPYARALTGWRRPAGFSLIELVILLAIVPIVAAIAAPVYQGYLNEARIDSAIQGICEMELILNDRFLDSDPPATLAAAGINRVDPWGHPYQYFWLRDYPAPGVNGARRRALPSGLPV